MLAFSSVVTADIGAAAFGLLATYTFWQFLRNPSPIRAGVAGVALGLAQASKFTMLVLYPAWTVVTMLAIIRPCTDTEKVPARRLISQFMLLVVTSVILLNAIYQCDGTFTALGAHRFKSKILTGIVTKDLREIPSGNRFRDTILAGLPVPFPKDYLRGLDSQKWEAEIGLTNLSEGRAIRGGCGIAHFVRFSSNCLSGHCYYSY